jgi:hypothetical protein
MQTSVTLSYFLMIRHHPIPHETAGRLEYHHHQQQQQQDVLLVVVVEPDE